jgi:hypothetical protein
VYVCFEEGLDVDVWSATMSAAVLQPIICTARISFLSILKTLAGAQWVS